MMQMLGSDLVAESIQAEESTRTLQGGEYLEGRNMQAYLQLPSITSNKGHSVWHRSMTI